MKKDSKNIVQAKTEEGQLLGEALVEAIENQIKMNDPTETKKALERLMAMGETRDNAIRLICSVLIAEAQEIIKTNQPFNEKRYSENLKNLPKLPYD